jgi:membrane-associated phospholipid phosphatase
LDICLVNLLKFALLFLHVSALLFDIVVVFFVKLLARRRRPIHNTMDMFATVSVDKFSFPSGHTTRAVTVTLFIVSLLPLRRGFAAVIIIWALLVALSRVMLGRHHIFDVFCGLAIGIVQYYAFVNYLWMSRETCEGLIRPVQEELHL